MAKGLFAKKSIHDLKVEASTKKDGLERSLTGLQLTGMGIGAIIGAGIFVLTGQAAAEFAGPAVVLSFIFAAIICVFAAFCYAEFASLIPVAGGAYSYAYATLGEIVAWTIGWTLTLEYLFSAATVAVGWSGYFVSLLADMGIHLSSKFNGAPLAYDVVGGWASTGAIINVPAVCILGIIGTLIAVGIKTAARINNIIVVIKLGVILLFLVCGVFYINTANWTPFIPENTGVFGEFGFSGIFRGAGVVFFAYIGFDALSTLAQEARNPQKDMPVGMIGSLTISAIIYICIALVLTGIVSYKLLVGPAPFSVAIDALGPKFLWLRYVAKIGILAGLTTVVLVMLIGQTRIFYTMSHDGLLPKIFGKVHKKFHTPFFNTIFFTVVGMLIAGFFPVGILGQLVSMGTLLAFAIVCFGVLLLRYKQPSLHRPFKVPFFPWIPLAGTLACVVQMVVLPKVIWLQLVLWIFVGFLVYFGYGIRHSVIRKKNKQHK
ncbi:MAG: putative amino acid permease YhdG [Chlamydiae bacterium]|nr:putative amino acid permease YhdG [Chlamydiota bacterium]